LKTFVNLVSGAGKWPGLGKYGSDPHESCETRAGVWQVHSLRVQMRVMIPVGVLQEALKHKRESWRMWENLMNVCLDLKKYAEVVYAMHQLLDLRYTHARAPTSRDILASK
jgi:hypothetical protein